MRKQNKTLPCPWNGCGTPIAGACYDCKEFFCRDHLIEMDFRWAGHLCYFCPACRERGGGAASQGVSEARDQMIRFLVRAGNLPVEEGEK
jgi:hypothetical protein